MRVYLIGYMYSGKSTLGRQLAQRLGWQFVDLDSLFESRYRTTVSLFFRQDDGLEGRTLSVRNDDGRRGRTECVPPSAA